MQLSEIDYAGQRPIEGYGPGFFRWSGARHPGPLALAGGAARPWGGWDDRAFAGVDVLILGTGAALQPVPPAFAAAIEALGAGLEPMATPAACRVYNMLLAESRRVGLAAFPL